MDCDMNLTAKHVAHTGKDVMMLKLIRKIIVDDTGKPKTGYSILPFMDWPLRCCVRQQLHV